MNVVFFIHYETSDRIITNTHVAVVVIVDMYEKQVDIRKVVVNNTVHKVFNNPYIKQVSLLFIIRGKNDGPTIIVVKNRRSENSYSIVV